MLNIKLLLSNISYFIDKIKIRDEKFNINLLLKNYYLYKSLKFNIDLLRSKKKIFSKKFFYYRKKNINIIIIKYFIKLIKYNIIFNKKRINKVLIKLNKILLYIPNIHNCDVPVGKNDNDNLIIYKWGNKKKYSFKILDHIKFIELSSKLNFNKVSNISGKCFSIIKGDIAFLYRAISQFMLDIHINLSKYNEVYVPYIVKDECLYGSGQLPKFSSNLFYIKNKNCNNLVLIPTAEVPLVNLFKNDILNEKDLPIKLVSNTPCFRYESKSYGKNNRGLIRLNQFDKIELVQIVKPYKSMNVLEELTNDAEKILKMLNLHYRKVLLCTNSMNFSSSKTYDIEVWSPIDNNYIEISSCSNTLDFQSRRMNIRYKNLYKKKNIFVHILNGSGLAIGRTLVAIIENFQVDTGVLKIPNVLLKYMNGKKYINCL